jgi:hypothetical protein
VVDKVINDCQTLHDIVERETRSRSSGSSLSNISYETDVEFLHDLRDMNNVVAMGYAASKSPLQPARTDEASGLASWVFGSLQRLNSSLRHTFVRLLISDNPEALDADDSAELRRLDELQKDQELQKLGLAEPLHIRKLVLDAGIKGFPKGTAYSTDRYHREYRYYDTPITEIKTKNIEKKVQKIASLLCDAGRANYRCLECVDYYHDAPNHRFVLVFKVPEAAIGPAITLHDFIRRSTVKVEGSEPLKKLPLGRRFEICYEIACAISQWHAVGWVHKNIRSKDILLFKKADSEDLLYDFYLGGFEYARPANAPSDVNLIVTNFEDNIYRHPERQDEPTENFHKAHDLYALGVLMLEVGLWMDAASQFPVKHRRVQTPEKIRQQLIKLCGTELGHRMGEAFVTAIRTCLESTFDVDMDDRFCTLLDKAFRSSVIHVLSQGLRL